MTNLFFVGPIGVSIPLIVKDILHEDAFTLSFYQGAWAAGLLTGSAYALLFNLHKNRFLRSLYLIVVQGVVMIALAQISVVWVHLAFILLVATCASMISIPIISYVQENTEHEMLGRVMGLLNMVSIGILPLAYAMVSVVMSVGVTVPMILTVCGSVLILFSLMVLIAKKDIRTFD